METIEKYKTELKRIEDAIKAFELIKKQKWEGRISFSKEEIEQNPTYKLIVDNYEDLMLFIELKKAFPNITSIKDLDKRRFIVAEDNINIDKEDMIIMVISVANSSYQINDNYGTRKATILAGLFEDIGDICLDYNARTVEKFPDGMIISFDALEITNAYHAMVATTMFQDTKTEEVNELIKKNFTLSKEKVNIKIEIGMTVGKVLYRVFGNNIIYPPTVVGITVDIAKGILKENSKLGTKILVDTPLLEMFLKENINVQYREKLLMIDVGDVDQLFKLCDINIDFRKNQRCVVYNELYHFYNMLKKSGLTKVKEYLNLDPSITKVKVEEEIRKKIKDLINKLFALSKEDSSSSIEGLEISNIDGLEKELINNIKEEIVSVLKKLIL